MSDYLSQDQIDSLLSGALDNGNGSEKSGAEGSNHLPAVASMFDLFCGQAGTVVSTVIGKNVDFVAELCEKADYSVIQEKIKAVVVSLSLSFKSGLDGNMYLIMQKKDVATLSDLMMMGDGSADYNEDHKDAIGELFNQVMGAFSTALGAELGQSISAGSVEVAEFELENPPFPPDSLDMAIAKMNVEGLLDSYVALLIPESIGTQLAEKKASTESETASDQELDVGLSQAEMDDLTKMSSDFSSDSALGQYSSDVSGGSSFQGSKENIELLLDVELEINIELGKSDLSIKKVLDLAPGSIVELDKMAGEPVDLLVNNKVVAKGEVVVVDESFGIRIVSLVSAEDRIKSLR
ncbi:MAG: flagellar motor switch protein FliN [Chitinispirillaceae bacterium]